MSELVSIGLVIALIVVLIWRRIDLGLSLLSGAIALGLLFAMAPVDLAQSVVRATFARHTLELVALVLMIIVLAALMKRGGGMSNLAASLHRLIPDQRLALTIPPALVGLLPMPGGAMFSAPMVEESGKKLPLSPEQLTFINYWFRHIWEYWWPLYPGLIIAAAVIKVNIRQISLRWWPMSIAALTLGLIALLSMPRDGGSRPERISPALVLWVTIKSLWPVWVVVVCVMVMGWPIVPVLAGVLGVAILTSPAPWRERSRLIWQAISPRTALLLASVMIFKEILEASGALAQLAGIFQASSVSPFVLIFSIPFLVGILTGVNQAYAAVAFPMLLPYLGGAQPDLRLAMFAYVGGHCGVLLSPVHLCLLLTKQHFRARWGGIYFYVIPCTALIAATAVVWVLSA